MKTSVVKLDPQYPDLKQIAFCAKVIRKGGIVVFPTETVYGMAADFANPKAMKRLRELKNRSEDKPFSILISQRGLISNYTSMTDPRLYKLIDACWPGPLTIVVSAKEEGKTIGVRMPDHPIALMLVKDSQCTIAAPSANVKGANPPSTFQETLRDMDGLVDVIIDGGSSRIGSGSSVVDMVGERPVMLREGAITKDDIEKIIKRKIILFVCTGNSCRSVMAEYLLKHMLDDRDNVEVVSAGTGVFLQSSASAETISVLLEEGIDATEHVSQPLNTILLKKADLIIVMTMGHRVQVLERVPVVEKRVYLLNEFTNAASSGQMASDVADPIGKPHSLYKECLEEIKEAIVKIKDLV